MDDVALACLRMYLFILRNKAPIAIAFLQVRIETTTLCDVC